MTHGIASTECEVLPWSGASVQGPELLQQSALILILRSDARVMLSKCCHYLAFGTSLSINP